MPQSACLTVSEVVADAAGWTPWRGGPCPLKPRTLVLIRLRFESFYDDNQAPRFASSWANWVHTGFELDVMAYKVVEA